MMKYWRLVLVCLTALGVSLAVINAGTAGAAGRPPKKTTTTGQPTTTAGATTTTLPATTTTQLATTTTGAMPTTTVTQGTFVYDVLVLASDSNATAQSKINAASSTAIIGFEAGTHFERKVTPKLGQTLRGNPNGLTVFDGSRLVTGWTGSNPWVASHTIADRGIFTDAPTRSADVGTQYPEELFYETPGQLSGWTRKERTGAPGTGTPAAGKWTMSYSAGTLRVADDPTGVNVRISVTDRAIVSPSTSAGGLTVEDITFQKYATDVFDGPAGLGTDHRDWIYRRIASYDNHGAGMYFGPGDQLLRSRIAYNGNSGMYNESELGGYIAGLLIQDSEISWNMQAPWNQNWGGGGSKFDLPASGSGGLVIRNSWWHHNRSASIWTDINTTETSTGNLIESNLIEDGEISGIFHEIGNPTMMIRWNRVRNMGTGAVTHIGSGSPSDAESSAGIDISNSRNTTVLQNVVENTRTGIMVRDDGRDPFLGNVSVQGNHVKAIDGNTVKFRPDTNNSRIATCGADNNRYWTNTFSYNNVFGMSFSAWQAARSGPGLTGALDPNGLGNQTGAVTTPAGFVPFVAQARYGPGV